MIKQPCGFPAPLVVNGSPFVGCQLASGHGGEHKVEITWGPHDCRSPAVDS